MWSRNCTPVRSTWIHPRILVWFRVDRSLDFFVMFYRSLFILLLFFLWSLYYMSSLDGFWPFIIFKPFLLSPVYVFLFSCSQRLLNYMSFQSIVWPWVFLMNVIPETHLVYWNKYLYFVFYGNISIP
jgi:hypothetical protein